MSGISGYGQQGFKRFVILTFSLVLTACGILPGMQNPHFLIVPNHSHSGHVKIIPHFVPITPHLILNQGICRYEYRVAPTDILQINVWQHPEFNFTGTHAVTGGVSVGAGGSGVSGYLVNTQGNIYFPLVGEIHVADKTVAQVRHDLALKLKKYVRDPQLNIRVAEFRGRKAYVLGEVRKTGFLPINDQQLTIAHALALSDWFDPSAADTSHIFVIRGSITQPRVYWLNALTPDKLLLAEHFSLQPNDILYVSSAPATSWNRAINQILPTIQAFWFTKAIVQQPF